SRRVSSFLRRAIWVSPLFYLDSRPLTQNSEHSLLSISDTNQLRQNAVQTAVHIDMLNFFGNAF
ncbi:MAG: hypothetical protein RLZZ511_4329, partial [Cyanobacteriota bacterium]